MQIRLSLGVEESLICRTASRWTCKTSACGDVKMARPDPCPRHQSQRPESRHRQGYCAWSSHREFEEGQVFGFQGGSRHSRAGPSRSRRGLVLPMGSSVQDRTWCSSKHLRQVGLRVLGEPSAPAETQCSRSDLLLQADPSAPGSSE